MNNWPVPEPDQRGQAVILRRSDGSTREVVFATNAEAVEYVGRIDLGDFQDSAQWEMPS